MFCSIPLPERLFPNIVWGAWPMHGMKEGETMRNVVMIIVAAVCILISSAAYAIPSGSGLSGGLMIPDTSTLAPERYEIAFTTELFDEMNPSTNQIDTTADMSFKLNVGVYDNLEMGIERKTRLETANQDESITIQAKYRFPIDTFNVSAGVVVPAGGPDYTSLFFMAGWKAIHLGFGFNFGGLQLAQVDTNTFNSPGMAKFGGYTLRRSVTPGSDEFIGNPDTFFGLLGANFQLSDSWSLLFDYNGDRFSGGMRFLFKDMHVDLAYVGQSEYDSLLDRKSMNFQLGAGMRF